MEYLLIRHGKADDISPAAEEGAPLSAAGREQATRLGVELAKRGIDVSGEPVAVSILQRTRQTAETAGFRFITTNPLLNEIRSSHPEETPRLLAQKIIPPDALAAARRILEDPPSEKIWITHGLIIMGIYELLGMLDPAHFVPEYCEVRAIAL